MNSKVKKITRVNSANICLKLYGSWKSAEFSKDLVHSSRINLIKFAKRETRDINLDSPKDCTILGRIKFQRCNGDTRVCVYAETSFCGNNIGRLVENSGPSEFLVVEQNANAQRGSPMKIHEFSTEIYPWALDTGVSACVETLSKRAIYFRDSRTLRVRKTAQERFLAR